MRSPGGGELSLSACPGVGNRPPNEEYYIVLKNMDTTLKKKTEEKSLTALASCWRVKKCSSPRVLLAHGQTKRGPVSKLMTAF